MRVPILAGPLRGAWWLLTSRGQTGRVLTGSYEQEHTRLFERWVEPGSHVLDVGAHVGYYTLLSARLAGPEGRVCAFEPDPRNCAHLRRHLAINRLANAEVVQGAVSNEDGVARFRFGSGSGTGHLSDDGTIEVETLSLDAFCGLRGLQPDFIKIDTEGAEVRVLEGARRTLLAHRPAIVLSTHGSELHRECITILRGLGYRLAPITGGAVEATSELICTPDTSSS
ncbi:MAG: FkbM family methyltransferase [Gemmatimonadota bacterium]